MYACMCVLVCVHVRVCMFVCVSMCVFVWTKYDGAIPLALLLVHNRVYVFVRRREGWLGYSTCSLWQTLLVLAEQDKKEHNFMADIYGVHMVKRLTELVEDTQRVHKRCRDIATRLQQDLNNSVIKLKEV